MEELESYGLLFNAWESYLIFVHKASIPIGVRSSTTRRLTQNYLNEKKWEKDGRTKWLRGVLKYFSTVILMHQGYKLHCPQPWRLRGRCGRQKPWWTKLVGGDQRGRSWGPGCDGCRDTTCWTCDYDIRIRGCSSFISLNKLSEYKGSLLNNFNDFYTCSFTSTTSALALVILKLINWEFC